MAANLKFFPSKGPFKCPPQQVSFVKLECQFDKDMLPKGQGIVKNTVPIVKHQRSKSRDAYEEQGLA